MSNFASSTVPAQDAEFEPFFGPKRPCTQVVGRSSRQADLTFRRPPRPIEYAPLLTIDPSPLTPSRRVFTIKICGVRRAEDLPHIAAAGADAVGLNFYPGSKRYLTPDEAEVIAAAVPNGVARVGVFVNASTAEMLTAAHKYGLDYLQLHGDEPPAQLGDLRAWPVIKAFRFRADGLAPCKEFIAACKQHGSLPVAVLVDAPTPSGAYGGTGMSVNWQALAGWRKHIDLPLVLAGGLNPANVAEAVGRVRPSAIDTASGVEAADGFKDAALTRDFIAAARSALE
jgi:phosphoribosylanthranilate isomerase